ncbi:MAG: archaellin/type IV pilin N-terminal domain-containing protein [Candidatus Micrarchaeaceae archaeon]
MRTKRKAISEMLAVIIMIALTIVAGAFVYQVFFSRASTFSSAPSITIQDVTISNGEIVLTVKNSGSIGVTLSNVSVYLNGGTSVTNTWTSTVAPGSTAVYTGSLGGIYTPGASYLIVVKGTTGTGSNAGAVEATTTVVAD